MILNDYNVNDYNEKTPHYRKTQQRSYTDSQDISFIEYHEYSMIWIFNAYIDSYIIHWIFISLNIQCNGMLFVCLFVCLFV
eukprot:COSAG06_NODE_43908_length_368_cov_0.561338_1_plen_80_part_01